jgi:hypothetical protein
MKLAKFAPLVLLVAVAPRVFGLTPAQKTELYKTGTIGVVDNTGKRVGHYEVKFMPGADLITRQAQTARHAAYLMVSEMAETDRFWRRTVARRMRDGVEMMRNHIVTKGIGALPEDFYQTCQENAQLSGEFGSGAGQVRKWLSFGGRAIGKLAHTLIGGLVGGAYTVVAPVGTVVLQPVGAAAMAAVGGVMVPALQYGWNGTAWVLVKDSNEPSRDGMTVTYVAEE